MLIVVILCLCGSALTLPASGGLETNGLMDAFTSKGAEASQGSEAGGKGLRDYIPSIFSKNTTSLSEADAKSNLPESESNLKPVEKNIVEPTLVGTGFDAVNAKYNEFISYLSSELPSEASFNGKLGQGLAGANSLAGTLGREIKTVAQLQSVELKALLRVKNLLQAHPEILPTLAYLIVAAPDFNDPNSLLKTIQILLKLNPELSSKVYGALKKIKLGKGYIPVDAIATISKAITSITEQFANPQQK